MAQAHSAWGPPPLAQDGLYHLRGTEQIRNPEAPSLEILTDVGMGTAGHSARVADPWERDLCVTVWVDLRKAALIAGDFPETVFLDKPQRLSTASLKF